MVVHSAPIFGHPGEFLENGEWVRQLEELLPPLNQLNYFAVHEIDAGNDHGHIKSRVG